MIRLISLAAVLVATIVAPAQASEFKPIKCFRSAECSRPAECSQSAPTTSAEYRAAFDALDNAEWGGADQTTTVALPDGRTVWLFGDTLGPGYFSHNSLVIQDRGCFRVIRPAIPDNPDGTFYWPSHGVVDDGELRVFMARVTGGAGMNFSVDGTEIARFSLPDLDYLGKAPTPSTDRPDTQIHWGAAVAQHGSSVYVWGNRKVEGPLIFGKAGYVAQVPADQLTQLDRWRYWDGSSWVDSESAAAKVLDEGTHEMSTNWSAHWADNQWVIVHKKQDTFGDEIVSLRSSNPYGPWTEEHLISVPPYSEDEFNYNAAVHPHLALASEKTLISLSFNSPGAFSDPTLYRPRFYELNP